jgi:hypothetical protein
MTDELTADNKYSGWIDLGNINYGDDGAIGQKTLYFGDDIIFKRIWFRLIFEVYAEGNFAIGPILRDFSFRFVPVPNNKFQWKFTVKCEDEMLRKDGTVEPKTGLWLRNVLRNAWLTKSILQFEDYDASAEVALDTSMYDYPYDYLNSTDGTINVTPDTDNFPEIGRLRIGDEEILYFGKTKTSFTGCIRGARGTNAANHYAGEYVNMSYRVLTKNYEEQLIVANDPRQAEYLVTLELLEA